MINNVSCAHATSKIHLTRRVKHRGPRVKYNCRMTFGDRIRQELTAQGMTPSEFARRIGVTKQVVHSWLSGQAKGLTAENAIRAAKELDVRIEWLLFHEPPKRSSEGQFMTDEQVQIFRYFDTLTEGQQTEVIKFLETKSRENREAWEKLSRMNWPPDTESR